MGREQHGDTRTNSCRKLVEPLPDIVDDTGDELRMPVPASDVTDGMVIVQERLAFLQLLSIGTRAQRRLLRRHAEGDDVFGIVENHLCQRVLDERMPMAKPGIDPEAPMAAFT